MKTFFKKIKDLTLRCLVAIKKFFTKGNITAFDIVLYSALLLFIVLCLIGADVLMALITIVFYFLGALSLRKGKSNIFFFFFIVSFFIFIVSGDLLEPIVDEYYYVYFSKNANLHAHICVLLSAISIFIAYVVSPSWVLTKIKPLQDKRFLNEGDLNATLIAGYDKNEKNSHVSYIRLVSFILFTIAYAILMMNSIYKNYFVSKYGYVETYLSYKPLLPSIISEFGEMAFVLLLVFLATMPTRKQCIFPLLAWFIYAVTTLFAGARGPLIYNTVLIVAYVIYRNNHFSYGKVWLSKKIIIIFLILVPFLLGFLKMFEYLRSGYGMPDESFIDMFVRFFIDIGASSKVIKYGYVYRNAIAENFRFFSLGEVINYYKYNPIFFWSKNSIEVHSLEYALEGHSFPHYVSYLVDPNSFVTGHGVGGAFVAILFADLGYFGVILGSFIYGFFFKQWLSFDKLNWVGKTMLMYSSYELLIAPRGSYDSFIAILLNLKFILIILAVWVCALLVKKFINRKSKEKTNEIQ